MESLPTVQIVVALALFDRAGRVLLQQRPRNKVHGGLWEFPGGKVEAGESCERALVRETDEELGVAVDVADISPIFFAIEPPSDSKRQVLLLLFGARNWHGEPRALEAGSTIAWVTRDEMVSLPMPPLDVPLAQAVIPFLEGVAKAETPP
ncbi:MAG: DNA mismatch repair protein MutT [Novosphingobium sp. 17-62-19]|nr:MAG: DNA mismatch repair protein MutT [Novosphingobium sp. 17-62-19]